VGWQSVPEPVRDGEVGAEVCTECVVEQRVPRALKEGLPVERFFRPTDDRIQRTVERASPSLESRIGLEEGRTHGFDCLRRIGVRFRRVLAVLGQTVEVVTELYLPVPNAEVPRPIASPIPDSTTTVSVSSTTIGS